MNRMAELLADYELLGRKLVDAEGAQAAAIVKERRAISAELEVSGSEEAALVDQLAQRRTKSGVVRPPVRRSESG